MIFKDDCDLISNINKYCQSSEVVPISITLPDYLDVTTLVAMEKRISEVVAITGKKVRLLGHTTNLDVEKCVTRLFAERNSIFTTIDWGSDNV